MEVGLKRNGKAPKIAECNAGLTGWAQREEDSDLNEPEILCHVNALELRSGGFVHTIISVAGRWWNASRCR